MAQRILVADDQQRLTALPTEEELAAARDNLLSAQEPLAPPRSWSAQGLRFPHPISTRSPQVPAMLVADAGEGLRLAGGAVDNQAA